MSGFRKANVFVRDKLAGVLEETDSGYKFAYCDKYLAQENPSVSLTPPVSLTLPTLQKEYFSPVLFPFFDGLIPEGWLLETVCRNWKLSTNDRFGILLAACHDPIGNVSVWAKDEEEPEEET